METIPDWTRGRTLPPICAVMCGRPFAGPTNQFASLPGATPTYDTDGRLTYDGTNHYTWDAEGKLSSINTTTTFTYDALGRPVERRVGFADISVLDGLGASCPDIVNYLV
jgi:YD repeat-containing protein